VAQKRRQPDDRATSPPSVDAATGIALLQTLVEKATALRDKPDLKESDVTAWCTTARDFLVRTFGSESPNVNAVLHASGDDGLYVGMEDDEFANYLRSGLSNKIKMLDSCIEQLQIDIQLRLVRAGGSPQAQPAEHGTQSNKVFVVHGHNHGIKESVARFLEKLDLDPIILHEKPNAGRTLIEKFSDYADVQFAVVLLTADDLGKPRESNQEAQLRARQNVILELGYFLGKLGRARVCALYESGVELPSDYQGVLFLPLDAGDRWKFDLVRELRAAGFSVDANRVFSAD
jgi:predicted nucleotide-binding protein